MKMPLSALLSHVLIPVGIIDQPYVEYRVSIVDLEYASSQTRSTTDA